ncbi:hypothetical protein CW696_03490 [ANME-2 cluster archaeon]|nr:DUF167 domain-containing protein [Methanosarcinales archaeon]RJS72104.1 MAG: hypothetical protein CW696_03490 [ANME-2 cluster archaeon]RLG24947.1 MAG: hypothetical protein DRN77_01215 [Methanosarcinales archaeon]
MSYEDAVKSTGNGVTIYFKVIPGSKRVEVPSGYEESRNRIRAKLSAKAIDGKANKQLIKELSRLFGINPLYIRLNGITSTKKSAELIGITRDAVIQALRPFFNDDCKK